MIIEYEISKYEKEKVQIEIKDTKNVFLKGTNPYDGLSTYFGIWTKEDGISIANITSWRNITYKHYLSKDLSTETEIQLYLQYNNNIEVITKNEFKKEIDHIRSILEI